MEAGFPRRRGRNPDRWPGFDGCGPVSLGLDFREMVEPGEAVLGQLAVLEAQVELLTDGQREPGDFAVASHRGLERTLHCLHARQ